MAISKSASWQTAYISLNVPLFLRKFVTEVTCILSTYDSRIQIHHKVKVIPQQAEVAQGIPGKLRPPDFLDVRHYKGGRSSAIRTSRLYPRRNPWYSFSEAESTSGHMVLSGTATEKIPSETTRNRSQNRPTSSADYEKKYKHRKTIHRGKMDTGFLQQ
jgi:hypothetical protein